MKILLFGKNGQVGNALHARLPALGEIVSLDFPEVDFSDTDALREIVRESGARIIINAAAYTAVDKAEQEAERCQCINADAVAVLAEEALTTDAWLVHYSSDYVFDGSKPAPYVETDPTAPLSVYGRSKRDGEVAIQEADPSYLIFRTSWVYSAHGENFAKTILRLAGEREQLRIINDQHGAPTSAELLADMTVVALRQAMERPELAGLYHLTPTGETTWYGYACEVLRLATDRGMKFKVAADAVEAIPTSAYPLPAQRPTNSLLDTAKFRNTFNVQLPDWHQPLEQMMNVLLKEKV